MQLTKVLAEFACNVTFEKLPPNVIVKTKQLMLDCLGNQIGAYGEESAQMLYDVLDVSSVRGGSSVVGYGTKTVPLLAGCVNGMLAHLLDMDDAHRDSLTKTGSAVTPAAMAIAEAYDCEGKSVIEAVVAGYETMIRLGLAVNPGHRGRGFHSTATLGTYGAAVAAGRLLRLDAGRMVDAVGMAGTQAAGLAAFINNAAMIKPFNVAKGVYNGILSALMAMRGFRGPPDIIEGEEGFIRAYSDQADPDRVVNNIGVHFHLLESGFKPHAACRYAHGPIDAAVGLMKKYGFEAEEIQEIHVHLSTLANRQSNFYEPKSIASAQGSTPFAIAAALVCATDSLSVSDIRTAFNDPRVWVLHRCIHLHVDSGMDYMGRGCTVRVLLRSGSSYEEDVKLPRGEPENPMSDIEIQQKFMRQAAAVIGERRARSIGDLLNRLETLPTISPIMDFASASWRCR
jgi:2-methylcitrate dehydratase PrpD